MADTAVDSTDSTDREAVFDAEEGGLLTPAPSHVTYLRRGDTLVLTFAEALAMEHVDRIRRQFAGRLPNNQILLVDRCSSAIVAPAKSDVITR